MLGYLKIGDLPSWSSLFVSLSTESRISLLRMVTFLGKLVVRRQATFNNNVLLGEGVKLAYRRSEIA